MVQEREKTRALPKPRAVQKHKNTGVSRKLGMVQKHGKLVCGAEALSGPETREKAYVPEA